MSIKLGGLDRIGFYEVSCTKCSKPVMITPTKLPESIPLFCSVGCIFHMEASKGTVVADFREFVTKDLSAEDIISNP